MARNFPFENGMKKAYIPTMGERHMGRIKPGMPRFSGDAGPTRQQQDTTHTLPPGDFPVFKETPKC